MPQAVVGLIVAAALMAAGLSAEPLAAEPLAAEPLAADAADMGGRFEVNAMEYPWSAIGRVNVGGRGHCTGFLVGERAVLTAAHCLYDAIEGRWRGPSEIHFVAGYQRDLHLIHAPVAAYERGPRFDPAAGATIRNAAADWAILDLAQPIGRQAGWLGLQRFDAALAARVRAGRAQLIQAGYRKGRSHIMSLNLNCRVQGDLQGEAGLLHSCHLAQGDSGSPLLVVTDTQIRVVGLHVLSATSHTGESAGALSLGFLQAGAPPSPPADWTGGAAPISGSPAEPVPLRTIRQLLVTRGDLTEDTASNPQALRAAISAFQARTGMLVTGAPSVPLLGQLILAAP